MKAISLLLNLTLTVVVLGQAIPLSKPLSPSDRPDIQTLSRTVQSLRRSAKLTGDAAVTTDNLIETATGLIATGQTGEARRRLGHAQALITGAQWEPKDEFIWSLSVVRSPQSFGFGSG